MTVTPTLILHGTAVPRLGLGTWRPGRDGADRHVSLAFDPPRRR